MRPLSAFPAAERAEIERLASLPTPPPKWLRIGLAQIPSRAWAEWHMRRGQNPRRLRETIRPALRARVIARDGYACQICGGDVDPGDVHIDHIVPVSRGGRNVLGNLQVAHSLCNMRKGNRL